MTPEEFEPPTRSTLPLYKLRDYVPVPKNARGKQEAKLAAALETLDLNARVLPEEDKTQAKAMIAIRGCDSDNELSSAGTKRATKSKFEKFFCSVDNEQAACYFLQFLFSNELVYLAVGSKRLVLYTTKLRFPKDLSIAELARIGRSVVASRSSSRARNAPGKSVMGILKHCNLLVGQNQNCVAMSSMEPLSAFFTTATRGECTVDRFSVQFDSTVNDLTILSFLKTLQKPTANRLRHLCMEGCMIGLDGMVSICAIMKGGSLPVLELLNVNRNNAQYMGIHKLGATLMSNCCPYLATVLISGNSARAAPFEFFDSNFAAKTQFLTTLEATNNDMALDDPDILAIINRGLTTWRNFTSLDLSFNPFGDGPLAKLLKQIWPITNVAHKPPIIMESLTLLSVEMGIYSLSYISQVMMRRDMTALKRLSIGANAIDLVAIKTLLEPIMQKKVALKELSLPLNLIMPEGVVLFQNAATMGALDGLEVLDIADVGANSDAIVMLSRALLGRFTRGNLCMRKLKIFGLAPVAGKNARVLFGKDFLDKVAVS